MSSTISSPDLATITALSHDGRGIAHLDGKLIFIRGALIGETVHFKLVRSHVRFDEAEIIAVLSHPSSERVDPPCPHVQACGGCTLQHLHPSAQRAFKQKVVLEQLQHQARIQPGTLLPHLLADNWGYRRKARLGVQCITRRNKKNSIHLGFREANTHTVVNVESCLILDPTIGSHFLEALRSMIQGLMHPKNIVEIDISVDDQDHVGLLIHHARDFSESDIAMMLSFAQQQSCTLSLRQLQGKHTNIHAHAETMSYTHHGLTFYFHPSQFIQINHRINQQLVSLALTMLDLQAHDIVLDLFCGIGNFTLPMAAHSASVTGVENNPSSVEQARENAKKNHLDNIRFYSDNLFDPPFDTTWSKRRYDKILLDPPRSGAKILMTHMQTWRPHKIVYISCDSATFARDTRLLVDQQYTLAQLAVADMFPHTRHTEVIALFENKKFENKKYEKL